MNRVMTIHAIAADLLTRMGGMFSKQAPTLDQVKSQIVRCIRERHVVAGNTVNIEYLEGIIQVTGIVNRQYPLLKTLAEIGISPTLDDLIRIMDTGIKGILEARPGIQNGLRYIINDFNHLAPIDLFNGLKRLRSAQKVTVADNCTFEIVLTDKATLHVNYQGEVKGYPITTQDLQDLQTGEFEKALGLEEKKKEIPVVPVQTSLCESSSPMGSLYDALMNGRLKTLVADLRAARSPLEGYRKLTEFVGGDAEISGVVRYKDMYTKYLFIHDAGADKITVGFTVTTQGDYKTGCINPMMQLSVSATPKTVDLIYNSLIQLTKLF